MQTILIDDTLIQAIRQITGTDNEQKIIELALREWLSKQKQIAENEAEWETLQQQKALYAHKIPPTSIEPPGTPTCYPNKPIELERMREIAKQAVGKRFKNV